MRRSILPALPAIAAALAAIAATGSAEAARTLDEYRHFRALSIDLQGRIPTRAELAAFEQSDFDVDAWIEGQLKGPGYVRRLRQIYLDVLRLQVGSSFGFSPGTPKLARATILGPDGKDMYVYYRRNQRRTRVETDGDFCMTPAETGLVFQKNGNATAYPPNGAKAVTQTVLNANTTVVKPWWLYADYKAKTPTQLYDAAAWASSHPGFVPADGLLTEPDGSPTTQIRVCKEEALVADAGTVFAPNNPANTFPGGRAIALPVDSTFAKTNAGDPLNCGVDISLTSSADCGCGVGLERCNPAVDLAFDPKGMAVPTQQPLGLDDPTDSPDQAMSSWWRMWWGEEASRFLGYVLAEDHDFREVLTARYTLVNGPLAQFYSSRARATCCGQGVNFGYSDPEPLFDPQKLPAGLLPHAAADWKVVADRGPHASGLLTMPVFLTKYGSRRARAHILYNAFKCKDFVAGNVTLKPSTEPNLMVRDGCSTCHAALEPMSAYFSRVLENDWTFLPPDKFPILNPACLADAQGKMPTKCNNYYDPAFADATRGVLRGSYPDAYHGGSYGTPAADNHTDQGPAGLGAELANDPEFPACVAENVTTAMLGRRLTDEDAAFKKEIADAFVAGGYRMSALVKAVVSSRRYRAANNLTSSEWRKEKDQ